MRDSIVTTPHPDATIGLLGGVGPAACAYAHTRLVELAQREYGACADADFPRIVVDSAALPGIDATGFAADDRSLVTDALVTAVTRLADTGATIIVAVCNTIDVLADDVAAALPAGCRLLRLPAAAATTIATDGRGPVGLLTSRASRREGVYETALAGVATTVVADDVEQDHLDEAIAAAMGGYHMVAASALAAATTAMRERSGPRRWLIGCTELSMLASPTRPVVDSLDCGLRAALALAYAEGEVPDAAAPSSAPYARAAYTEAGV